MSDNTRFLFTNGVIAPPVDTPPVTTLLQAYPGAYTTTRTRENGSKILFWERHLRRLCDSVKILVNSKPEFLFQTGNSMVPLNKLSGKASMWDGMVRALVNDSMKESLPVVFGGRNFEEEMAITTLVSGNLGEFGDLENLDEEKISGILNVYLHFGSYIPPSCGIEGNGAHLAIVGRGRNVANAKHSDWVRHRMQLEKLRPPSSTELLLSNDGDHILEGAVTNFFVVCRRGIGNESFEIQTAPLKDGVLPGVIRQVISDVCFRNAIPIREVAPSWAQRDLWQEAFITNSLRLVQHVQTIVAPNSWESLESKAWTDVTWEEKQFQECPGRITSMIKKSIMESEKSEACPITSFYK